MLISYQWKRQYSSYWERFKERDEENNGWKWKKNIFGWKSAQDFREVITDLQRKITR